ncbi:MAG: enoyl-CoA hydratase-related protein [Planctomycetota bacterium]
MSLVTVQTQPNGIATIALNDPDRRNAMSEEMAGQFKTVVERLGDDKRLRSVILTGAGRAFAAGGDLGMLKQKAELDVETNRQRMLEFYKSFLCILRLPVPLIAAVNGHAIGAGLAIALACDFRIVSDSAKFGLNFVRIGLHPGMGSTLFAPRICGTAAATDLLVSGRIFTTEEAQNYGIATRVASADRVLEEAIALAESLQSCGPAAVQGLLETLRPSKNELSKSLEHEASEQAANYASAEFAEGIAAALERRSPKY